MSLEVHQFPVLRDNYAFLVRDTGTGFVGCIDTPDGEATLTELNRLGWPLTIILNTHWHADHTGGNALLQSATGCTTIGPAEVAARIPLQRIVHPGELVRLGDTRLHVLDVGGHTLGHVAYHDAADKIVFVGDCLFSMGCGRLLEGTAEQMWSSLQRLADLPGETVVYSAHEYGEANARFAISVDQQAGTRRRAEEIFAARARGQSTVPSTIALEKATNPFLRAPILRLDQNAAAVQAFAAVRAAKDAFKG